MNRNFRPDIAELLKSMEQSFGLVPHTPRNFKYIRQAIFETTGEYLGLTTLKRLWGYDKSKGNPQLATLNILARALGFNSFGDFVTRQLLNSPKEGIPLTQGSVIIMRYEGNGNFKVINIEQT